MFHYYQVNNLMKQILYCQTGHGSKIALYDSSEITHKKINEQNAYIKETYTRGEGQGNIYTLWDTQYILKFQMHNKINNQQYCTAIHNYLKISIPKKPSATEKGPPTRVR